MHSNNFIPEIIKVIDIQDLTRASTIVYQLVCVALVCDDNKTAQQLFEYIVKRAPDELPTRTTAKILKAKDPKQAAIQSISLWKFVF
jgi:hypothetical protein